MYVEKVGKGRVNYIQRTKGGHRRFDNKLYGSRNHKIKKIKEELIKLI